MATTEPAANAHDRNRRHPFTLWMRRLANLKNSSSEGRSGNSNGSTKRTNGNPTTKSKKPFPGKGKASPPVAGSGIPTSLPGSAETTTPLAPIPATNEPLERERKSMSGKPTGDGHQVPLSSGRSTAATATTEPGTTHSDATRSTNAESVGATTNITAGGDPSSKGGAGSTFSSPAPSLRSLTTTLTTVQSTGPAHLLPSNSGAGAASAHAIAAGSPTALAPTTTSGSQSVQFSHQFPTLSAIPSHLSPQSASATPTTYTAATANNLLTDNASILTLASSSKRQRRHSLDTNASVRALAPSSLWGGSRESLPLSVLSSNVGDLTYPPTPGIGRPTLGGNAERASVYSASGIAAPALSSERNSYYAGKQNAGGGVGAGAEGGSVKSGLAGHGHGHGRSDSVSGSIGGASLTVASPREMSFGAAAAVMPGGRMSRRSSGWADVSEEAEVEHAEKAALHKLSSAGLNRGVD